MTVADRDFTRRDFVVMGASAGGVDAFTQILGALPADFPAAIALTLHRSPTVSASLPKVIGRHSVLPVIEPEDGQPVEQGVVYVAPADVHMVIHGRIFRLERTPKQNHARPAIDPLFESAAVEFGPRVIGVVLTGNLGDGVAGLISIHANGGLCLAQDPGEALFPSMPLNALRYDHVDHVFRQKELPPLLDRLVRMHVPAGSRPMDR